MTENATVGQSAVPQDFLDGIADAVDNQEGADESQEDVTQEVDDQETKEEQGQEQEQEQPPEDSGDESDSDDSDEENDTEDDDLSDKSGDDSPGQSVNVSDELLERAVKAGIPLDEARKTSSSMLELVCARIEKSSSANQETEKEEDPLSGIPDIVGAKDGGEYDDVLADAYNGMKSLIAKQSEVIKEMKSAMAESQKPQETGGPTWADAKFSELGDDFKSVFGQGDYSDMDPNSAQAKERKRIESHMNYFLEDAKESGDTLTRSEAFKKAVEVRHGSIIQKQNDKKKAESARKRSAKTVNRPGKSKVGKAKEYSSLKEREADAISAVAALYEDA